MKENQAWRDFWQRTFASAASDVEADRLTDQRDRELDALSHAELLEFVDAHPGEVVLDAGCGSGGTIVMIHAIVDRIIAIDFAESAIQRATANVKLAGVTNAELSVGDISDTQLPERSFDRVICLSVFHYIPDDQVRSCLRSFARLLRPEGVLVLHVKNLSSPYLATLQILKSMKRLVGSKRSLAEHFRSFAWYVDELQAAGFRIAAYNSFNLLVLEGMPGPLVRRLQKLEFRRRTQWPFRLAFLRRHGADLKIRAELRAH